MEELEICLALERLRRLSDEETTSVIGVCEEIENTTEVLMVNQPIFTNLHPSQIDKMINKIDESTCHIEDVIMAHGHGKKYNKEKVSSIIFEIRQLHKQIKETADNTRDDSRLGFTMDEERERNEGERTAIFDPDDFIGPLEEVDHVVNRLIDTERNGEAEAISLCGPGGVGKTAFARKVWNDPRIALGFFHMMWIRVSSKVDIKNILLDVIRHFERKTDGINNMSEYELAERIKSCIRKGGRCLIVLDDVWSTQVLDKVQCLFRDKHRILLTTRKRQVAEYGIPKPFIYTLRGLSPENAWELFAKSFPPGYWRRRPVMEKMAKEIVKQCEGLPVAIIRLAQELAGRESLAELKIVHENTVSFLKDRLSQVLAPSIHDLPDQLKLCFLYLGLWPEDATIIDVEKLHHFWLVEGLVKLQDLRIGETSLNVVEQYLTELARRSLVEVEEEEAPSIRRLKCCRVHRIMRSLCISKGSHIGSSYTIDCRLGSYSTSSASGNKARRLFVYLESPEDISSILANKELTRHLHCIQFLGTHEQQRMEPVRLSGKLKDKELTLLKLLDFDGVDFRQYELPTKKGMSGLLEGICKLVHLRYLSFKGCYLDKLPSTISNFSFLQILDLRTKDSSTEVTLPNVLWMIGKLKHLYLPRMFRTNDGEKLQLDGLTELETLENFITKVCNVGDMHSLTRLQYVAVIIDGNLSDLRFISQYMRKTSNKQIRLSIDLRSFDCFVEERHSSLMEVLQFQAVRIFCIQGHIHELPPSCDISPSLTKIVLRGSELEKDPMEKLAELPCLRVLILDNAFVGTDMVCPTSGFPELKRLELITFQFLERWKVESESMPKVFNIKIEYCEKLASIPDGFECLTTLKELEIAKMPPSFEDRLREIDGKHGEDMAKVKNVKITFSQ